MSDSSARRPAVLGIDHLLTPVHDLDRATAVMQRLGFTVSPRGIHSPHLGSANNTIMFGPNYIELWGMLTPTPFNAIHRQNLARGEGLHAVALTADDLARVAADLAHAGIATDAPVPHSRPVVLPGGRSGEARFVVLRPERSQLTAGFMFYCRHETPELVWVPELLSHENGAEAITALVIAAPDPLAAAGLYTHLVAGAPPLPIAGGACVATGKGDLEFLTLPAIVARYGAADVDRVASPFYKVVRLAVRDLDRARTLLRANRVNSIETAQSVLVPPAEASGLLLELVPSGI